MIHAVYLNPTVDRTVYVDSFRLGETNRITHTLEQGGGKALNVARMLDHLGVPVALHGFLFSGGSAPIVGALSASSIQDRLLRLPGVCRVNTKLFDHATGITTELNESGAGIASEQLSSFERALFSSISSEDFLILTGSLSLGLPEDYYAHLCNAAPCKTIVDADGPALSHALDAGPFLIKPNAAELSRLLGKPICGEREILDAGLSLIHRGAEIAAISLGAGGSIITDGRRAYKALPMHVPVDSTVGAGDSMIGGMVCAFASGHTMDAALRLGTAAASASISLPGTQLASKADVDRIAGSVELEEIPI